MMPNQHFVQKIEIKCLIFELEITSTSKLKIVTAVKQNCEIKICLKFWTISTKLNQCVSQIINPLTSWKWLWLMFFLCCNFTFWAAAFNDCKIGSTQDMTRLKAKFFMRGKIGISWLFPIFFCADVMWKSSQITFAFGVVVLGKLAKSFHIAASKWLQKFVNVNFCLSIILRLFWNCSYFLGTKQILKTNETLD